MGDGETRRFEGQSTGQIITVLVGCLSPISQAHALRLAGASATLLLVLLGACRSIVPLSEDLGQREQVVLLSGQVLADGETSDLLVVATAEKSADTSDPETVGELSRREVVAFSRLTSNSAFALVVPRGGKYWVTAFGDGNGNGQWDDGESGAELGGDAGIRLLHDLTTLHIELATRPVPANSLSVEPSDSGSSAIELRTGLVSTLDDPHLSAAMGVRGLWQPLAYGAKVGFGVDFLEPYDPDRLAVLFINGAGGSPQDWRSAIDRLDRQRYQPWVLVYPSGAPLDGTVGGVVGVLAELGKSLGVEEVVLVAHSMGGLVARGVADALGSPQARPQVRQLVTVATPFEGHTAANQGVRFSPAVVPSWRDLQPGSDHLAGQAQQRLRGRVSHAVFFSFGGPSWLMSHNNDGVVTLSSQLPQWLQEDADFVRGFDRDHETILEAPEMLAWLKRVLAEAASR